MPYASMRFLPSAQVKKYSRNQKRAFMSAFNSAHGSGKSEESCFAIAHSAAQGAGKKKVKARKR